LKRLLLGLGMVLCASITMSQDQIAPKTKQDRNSGIEISNIHSRTDDRGKIIDAHDGRVIHFEDRYYWYGTRYGQTNGFTEANSYVCYSSKDLKSWKFEGQILPQASSGVYYRPHVIWNAKTKKYVLWYNWYPKLWNGQFGVAVSDHPTGPFTVVDANVRVKNQELGVGDLSVFVDDDGEAYISYNTIQGHRVSLEKLNRDYTSSTLENSGFIAEHCEAGSIFKRNGVYYLMTDYTCCFCAQGSGARVYRSKNIMGPYQYQQNINRYPGNPAPYLLDGAKRNGQYLSLSPQKNQGVELTVIDRKKIKEIIVTQFTGNRPNQCGEVNNPLVHTPIPEAEIKIFAIYEGTVNALKIKHQVKKKNALTQEYHFELETPVELEGISFSFTFLDSTQQIHLAEIELLDARKSRLSTEAYFGELKNNRLDYNGKPIIPAQQTHVLEIKKGQNTYFIWQGDLWGSATNGIKGHDFQYWSAPLQFSKTGWIKPLSWTDSWRIPE